MTYFHPGRMPVLPAIRREAARRQLEQVVRRSAARRRGRWALAATGLAIVVLTTGAAALAVAVSAPVTNRTQARCYTVTSLPTGDYTTVMAPGRLGSPDQVRRAIAVCAALYRQGYLRLGLPGLNRSPGPGAGGRVPRLVACTMTDGEAAILPGGPAACARAGLPLAARGGAPPS